MAFEPTDYSDKVLVLMQTHGAYYASYTRATLSAMQITDLDRNDKQSNSEKVWPQPSNCS